MKQHIYIGSDHAGFKLKEKLKTYLDTQKINYVDVGNHTLDPQDDYPDFGILVAEAVAKHKTKGILVCGSSYGVCIVANKKKGIRAVSIANVLDAKLSREHNDANVLCLSGWQLTKSETEKVVKAWLNTDFTGEVRHKRRLNEIKKLEKENFK